MRMLPISHKKEFDDIRNEVEARAVTLRLADKNGRSTALQIVGNSDKMMDKYKDRIPLVSQLESRSRGSNWNYYNKSYYHQKKRKKYSPPSSDSDREDIYRKSKKRNK